MTEEERKAIVSDGLLSVKAAQTFTGLSRSKLYQLMEEGQLPYVRFGEDGRRAARRIPRAGLIAYIARHLVGGKSDK